MFKPLPPTGARTLDSRTAFYYGYTLDSPGMIMRIPGVGSQYLMSFLDPDGSPVRRRQDLQGDAAQGHSGRGVLVVHALRQPDALDAADAAEISARRQPELSLARRRGRRRRHDDGLFRPDPAGGRGARQLDPDRSRRRAGSRSCASTARCRRSSTRPGGRARSSWCSNAANRRGGDVNAALEHRRRPDKCWITSARKCFDDLSNDQGVRPMLTKRELLRSAAMAALVAATATSFPAIAEDAKWPSLVEAKDIAEEGLHLRPAAGDELRGHVGVRRRHELGPVQGAVQRNQQHAPCRHARGHGSHHAQQRHALLVPLAGPARRADGDLGAGGRRRSATTRSS